MKVSRAEQHRIKKSNKFFPIIDDLCWKSKNMYNYGNYIVRQEFIQTSKEKEEGLRGSANWIQYNKLFLMCKESEPYKELGSNVGQATLRKLDKNWKSFFKSIADWSKHPEKYLGRPKMPGYLPKENRVNKQKEEKCKCAECKFVNSDDLDLPCGKCNGFSEFVSKEEKQKIEKLNTYIDFGLPVEKIDILNKINELVEAVNELRGEKL